MLGNFPSRIMPRGKAGHMVHLLSVLFLEMSPMSSNLRKQDLLTLLLSPYLDWDHDITLSQEISTSSPERCSLGAGLFGQRNWWHSGVTMFSDELNTSSSSSPPALSSSLSLSLSNPSAWWNSINRDTEELSVHQSVFCSRQRHQPWYLSLMKSNELLRGTSLTGCYGWY